tara:strand:+ start:244 stop:501 length:258 start_codon:yes stop_codon:yes gene_type:complete
MKQVLLYTGEHCSFCEAAKALLKTKNVVINEIDISKDPSKKLEMEKRTGGAKTIPQIFIGDTYIGGNDQLQLLERNKKLDKIIKG